MVAELPTGAQAGLGARLLTGSYYGNTVQIWSALVMSALLGLALTAAVAGVERLVLRHRRQAMKRVAMLAARGLGAGGLAGAALLLLLCPQRRAKQPDAAGSGWPRCCWRALAVQSIRRVAALDGTRLVRHADRRLVWPVGAVLLAGAGRGVRRAPRAAAAAQRSSSQSHGGSTATMLWGDFVQTVLKAVLIGWAVGCGLGFAVAVAIDRMPFLQRGLLPLASLTSTIPLVAVAPIAVMWFGFEWPSKAAVVVLMTFFPMLVSTLAGLQGLGQAGARADVQLCRQLQPHAAGAAFAGGHALHVWRAQGQRHAGPDWRHRGRVLWLAHRRAWVFGFRPKRPA